MNRFKIILTTIILTATIALCPSSKTFSQSIQAPAPAPQIQYTSVNALEVVAFPSKYLNKNIKIRAKFDKFSTLGLDYPPINRPHEKYISFLIQRPDITNHNIPLSELKIFLKKEVAEKNIDLDAGDEIEFTGKVFSTALGDPWMDVVDFKVVNKVKKDKEKSDKK